MDKVEQLPRPWNQSSRTSSRPSGGTGGSLAVFVLLGFLCLSSLGCGNSIIEPPGGEPTQDAPVPPPLPVGTSPSGTSVLLQVVSDSGSPVAGAAVSSQGAVYPVDSSGHLLLENLQPGRVLAPHGDGVVRPGFGYLALEHCRFHGLASRRPHGDTAAQRPGARLGRIRLWPLSRDGGAIHALRAVSHWRQ